MLTSYADVKKALENFGPTIFSDSKATRAAVALILREKPCGMQMLFIERAPHDKDPWSGNIGFPGGKVEEIDGDARMAAERETMEEIGIDLGEAVFLGSLSEISSVTMPLRVSCYVYGIVRHQPIRLSEEIKDIFWVPLAALLDRRNHGDSVVRFAGRTLTRPAFKLPQAGKPVLWGLTYRFVMQFLDLLQNPEADGTLFNRIPEEI